MVGFWGGGVGVWKVLKLPDFALKPPLGQVVQDMDLANLLQQEVELALVG